MSLVNLTEYIVSANHEHPISDYSQFLDKFKEAAQNDLLKYYKMDDFKFLGAKKGSAIFQCQLSRHSCFDEAFTVLFQYVFRYERPYSVIVVKVLSGDTELISNISQDIEILSRTDSMYLVRLITATAENALKIQREQINRIPFDKLKETIGVLKVDYDNFMEHEFPVNIFETSNSARVFQTLSVTRGHFSFGDPSFCAEIYSDKGMQYLADRLSKVLTGKHEEDPGKQFDDDSITDFGLIILKNEMCIVSDEDMDHQDIKPGTICYDRDKRQYVAYLQDVNEEVMVDYRNAYVQILPATINEIRAKATGTIETTGKVNLIPQY